MSLAAGSRFGPYEIVAPLGQIRSDGAVKVFDFGLIKALGAEGTSATSDGMNSPLSPPAPRR